MWSPFGSVGQRTVATSWKFGGHLCTLWTLQRPSARWAGSATRCTVLPTASDRRNVSGIVYVCMYCGLRTHVCIRHDAGEWIDAWYVLRGPFTARPSLSGTEAKSNSSLLFSSLLFSSLLFSSLLFSSLHFSSLLFSSLLFSSLLSCLVLSCLVLSCLLFSSLLYCPLLFLLFSSLLFSSLRFSFFFFTLLLFSFLLFPSLLFSSSLCSTLFPLHSNTHFWYQTMLCPVPHCDADKNLFVLTFPSLQPQSSSLPSTCVKSAALPGSGLPQQSPLFFSIPSSFPPFPYSWDL